MIKTFYLETMTRVFCQHPFGLLYFQTSYFSPLNNKILEREQTQKYCQYLKQIEKIRKRCTLFNF